MLLLMAHEEDTDASRASQNASWEGSEVEPELRDGGVKLPGLKYWRLRRGLSQVRLAERVDTDQRYLSQYISRVSAPRAPPCRDRGRRGGTFGRDDDIEVGLGLKW